MLTSFLCLWALGISKYFVWHNYLVFNFIGSLVGWPFSLFGEYSLKYAKNALLIEFYPLALQPQLVLFYEEFGSNAIGITLEPINLKTWQKKYPAS
jgi:hypothetical protein